MRSSEVLAFLPLLIYGIAIAELFSQWKRFINFKNIYIPYALITIMLTEIAVYNVYLFAQLVAEINLLEYKSYLVYILPPFIFMLAVNIFTPEKEDETEKYFKSNMPIFFLLLSLYVLSHYLFGFDEPKLMFFGRIIIIIWLLITGMSRRIWMVYVFSIIWLFMLIYRMFFSVFDI